MTTETVIDHRTPSTVNEEMCRRTHTPRVPRKGTDRRVPEVHLLSRPAPTPLHGSDGEVGTTPGP